MSEEGREGICSRDGKYLLKERHMHPLDTTEDFFFFLGQSDILILYKLLKRDLNADL